MRLILPVALAASVLVFAACGRNTDDATSNAVPLVPAAPALRASAADQALATTRPAWLRERLPTQTIAYLRLPATWSWLGTPDGRNQDVMLSSTAYVEALAALRRSLGTDEMLRRASAGTLPLLLAQTTPLEIALLGQGSHIGPQSQLLLTLGLDMSDRAALGQQLGTLLGVPAPDFSAAGHAQLDINGLPVLLRHDADARRLWLLAGGSPTFAALDALIEATATPGAPAADSPLARARALEDQIDASGHGFVAWLATPAIAPLLPMLIPARYATLRTLLADSETLALGAGAASRQGRLAVRLQYRHSPWAELMPVGPFEYDFATTGAPDWVVTLALPALDGVRALLKDKDDTAPSLDATLINHTGLDLAGWFAPFGREALALRDDSGQYYAIRIVDAAALDRVIAALAEFAGAPPRHHTYHGHTLHYLQLPGLRALAGPLAVDADPVAQALFTLLQRPAQHLYWYLERDWLIVSRLPQPLMARIDAGPQLRQPVDGWLRATQGSARSQSLLSVSTQLDKFAQRVWHARLHLLQTLADLSQSPLDLFALPTAAQLTLPRQSGYGAELVVDGAQLVLGLNYEHTPFDPLLDGNPALATAGILAAIAVPAYQDYRQRAQITQAVQETVAERTALTRIFTAEQSVPSTAALLTPHGLALPRELASTPGTVSYAAGALRLEFTGLARSPATPGPLVLYMIPALDAQGAVRWSCGPASLQTLWTPLAQPLPGEALSTLPAALLPAECRAAGEDE